MPLKYLVEEMETVLECEMRSQNIAKVPRRYEPDSLRVWAAESSIGSLVDGDIISYG